MIYDSAVYVGAGNGVLYAFNELTGATSWTYTAKAAITVGTALHNTKEIAFADSQGNAYLLSATGMVVYGPYALLGKKAPAAVTGVAAVQGNVFYNMVNGAVEMVRIVVGPSIGWSFNTNSALSTYPSIVDGTVYIGSPNGLYAFTPEGVAPMAKRRGVIISISNANAANSPWQCTTVP